MPFSLAGIVLQWIPHLHPVKFIPSQNFVCRLLRVQEEYLEVCDAFLDVVSWSLIIIVLLLPFYFKYTLYVKSDEARWIEKKSDLLDALVKDYDQLLKEAKRLISQARSFWDSHLNLNGIRLQLSDTEEEWIDSIREVVADAKNCLKHYKKQSEKWVVLLPINDVVRQIDSIRNDIRSQLGDRDDDVKRIYESMEKSRSKSRALLDRFTIEEHKSVPEQEKDQTESSISIEDLVRENKERFSGMEERLSISLLVLLNTFLKDLGQVRLETETERSWEREALELIKEAQDSIAHFLSQQDSIAYFLSGVEVRFKGKMKRISRDLYKLLKRKAKYGFKFTDTAAVKSRGQSRYQDTEDITSVLRDLSHKVERSSIASRENNLLRESLWKMQKTLEIRKETAERNAFLQQIKATAEEVVLNALEISTKESGRKLSEGIQLAVLILQLIIEVCHIEREYSTSAVGLENDTRKLVSELISNAGNPAIISIVGMMGVGKTTLAKEIFVNKNIMMHFPIRAWVPVSQNIDETKVLLYGSKLELPLRQAHNHLTHNRCLVVLDNVSSKEDWDNLNRKLPLSGISGIVITTRSREVASCASKVHQLGLRTKEESWRLFEMVISKANLDPAVGKRARQVLGRCGGLPLAILSLACLLLANGGNIDRLRMVMDRINKGHNQRPWLMVCESCYPELDELLKRCLSCFKLFPADFEIPVRRLVTLWVAEGLVEQNDGLDDEEETLEDVAAKHIATLRDWNLIQAVELKSNGKIWTCRLPGVLRELIMPDNNRTSHDPYWTSHLQQQFASQSNDCDGRKVFSWKRNTVVFLDTREGNKTGEHIGNTLYNRITSGDFKMLKVLDLERVFRPQLPKVISTLIHLKYLGLRWTSLEAIPPFIGKLLSLETLDVDHTSIRTIPSSIWRLKKLRNLYLNRSYRTKLEGELGGNLPENLQTLGSLFIDENSPLLHGLHWLRNLRKLKLAFQLTPKQQEAMAKSILQLKKLRYLSLSSVDDMGKPQDLMLKSMSQLEKLSTLKLSGKLDVIRMGWLPKSLTDLTLSSSELPENSMLALQSLPRLKSLCLYAKSYTGRSLVCTIGSFQELKLLRLWKLDNLEEWTVQQGAMPKLLNVEIRSCSKLKFPEDLKNLKTLHTINLRDMPHDFIVPTEQSRQTFWNGISIVWDDWSMNSGHSLWSSA